MGPPVVILYFPFFFFFHLPLFPYLFCYPRPSPSPYAFLPPRYSITDSCLYYRIVPPPPSPPQTPSLPIRRHDRPAPGYYPYSTTGRWYRGPTVNRSPPSIAVAVPQPGPLPAAKPPDDALHRKRCLRGKADFVGSTQFPANTAFAARAAIPVAAVRWRRRCGSGGASSARHPHATRDRVPHPPRGHRLDSPHHLPPLPGMAPASPNCLTATLGAFLCSTSSGSPSSVAVAATAIGAVMVKVIAEYPGVRWWRTWWPLHPP